MSQFWNRVVAEVTDRAGLEELAKIRLDLDPANQTASLARLMVHGDGQLIDPKTTVCPQVHRSETRQEDGIIDATITAAVQVPDLRVGATLDGRRVWMDPTG